MAEVQAEQMNGLAGWVSKFVVEIEKGTACTEEGRPCVIISEGCLYLF